MNKINKSLIIGSLLLVVVIPLTTWLVGKNQENRSKAASETEKTEEPAPVTGSMVDGVCGEANGTTVKTVPSNGAACSVGAVNWMDSKATDGDYNWKCAGTIDGAIVDCSAEKQ